MFFQWRASRVGAERHHSGMVPHAGEDSRVFREVRSLGADLRRLGEVAGRRVRAPVALLLDWEDLWRSSSAGTRARASRWRTWSPTGSGRCGAWASWPRARPESDLSAYAVVVAPNLYLVTDAASARLAAYVAAGGCLVVGFFSGVVDERLHVRLGGWPAPAALRDAVGVRVEEHRPLGAAERLDCASEALGRFRGTYWMDDLRAEGASAVASVEDGDFAGMPVVLRNARGRGAAWYVGTRPDEAGRAAIVRRVCADAGVRGAVTDLPADVECVPRGDVLFLLNHGDLAARVEVAGAHEDLLTGARSDGPVTLDRFGVAALRGLRAGQAGEQKFRPE